MIRTNPNHVNPPNLPKAPQTVADGALPAETKTLNPNISGPEIARVTRSNVSVACLRACLLQACLHTTSLWQQQVWRSCTTADGMNPALSRSLLGKLRDHPPSAWAWGCNTWQHRQLTRIQEKTAHTEEEPPPRKKTYCGKQAQREVHPMVGVAKPPGSVYCFGT